MPFKKDNYIFNGPFTIGQIAKQIGAEIIAPEGMSVAESIELKNLAPLGAAGESDLTFFDNVKYLEQFLQTNASACICHPKYAERAPKNLVLLTHDDAYVAYARASQAFYSSKDEKVGIHPQTDIHPSAKIGDGCAIGAFTSIGEGVVVGANCVIGRNVSIRSTHMGQGCVVHDGVRIGQEGFGFAMGKSGHVKVPQLGGVLIGDFVEIGANSCIDRGAGPNTVIGSGTKIDNLVQIAHNVEIGKNCVITAQVGIAGSTKIDDFVILGGKAGISGHLKIGSGARVAANSGVIKDIAPHTSVGGYPSMNIRDWHKSTLLIEKMVKEKKNKE